MREETGKQPSSTDRQRARIGVALREAMREHGIPSDWMGCQTLPAVNSGGDEGMHVQFFIRRHGEGLLARAPDFEATFLRHLRNADSGAAAWLFGIGWVLLPGSFPASTDRTWRLPMVRGRGQAQAGA